MARLPVIVRMAETQHDLDETLYRPGMPGLVPEEVALYFSRDL